MASSRPFPITIVGAGIAGLTAALHLRKSGYEVTVFEQSRLAAEIGAAFHVTPNACSILAGLDIDVHDGGAVDYLATNILSAKDGSLVRRLPKADVFAKLPEGDDWVLAHRFHLHRQLKDAAVARGVDLVTSKHLDRVDRDTLELHFQDGSTYQAQCVIGADGVHSKVREALHPDIHPGPTRFAAFRFMLDRSAIEKHAGAFEKGLLLPGELYTWGEPETLLIVYPTTADTQLNFVGLFPVAALHDDDDDAIPAHDNQYSQKASKQQMLDVFHDFEPQVQELMRMTDPDGLRYWPLMDMPDLPAYVSGRIALLGDAAHPFLPFAYQGASMAIEDGAAIGVMLEGTAGVGQLAERFALYERLRHARCSWEQQFSRDCFGTDRSEGEEWDSARTFADIYLYRVVDEARKLKRECNVA